MAKKRQLRQAPKSNTPEKKKRISNQLLKPNSNNLSRCNSKNPGENQTLELSILHFLQCHKKGSKGGSALNNGKVVTIENDDDRSKLSSDILFQGAIGLSSMNHDRTISDTNDEGNEGICFSSSVAALSSFLLDKEEIKSNVLNISKKSSISKIHVANLMLPWLIESLITSSKGGKLDVRIEVDGSSITISDLWKLLSICLEVLLFGTAHDYEITTSFDEAALRIIDQILDKTKQKTESIQHSSSSDPGKDGLASILAQGILNKLVPYAIECSLKCNETPIKFFATHCCCIITMSSYYRPTMDLMSKTIIPLVYNMMKLRHDEDENNNGENIQKFSEKLISFAILKQLDSLQQIGRATNPKKNFIALSSTKTLTSLMKLGRLSQIELDPLSRISGEFAQKFQELNEMNSFLLKDIMFNGLFNLEHHMEGFCSLRYTLPKLKVLSGQQRMDTDDDRAVPKSHLCYQQKIFESIQDMHGFSGDEKDDCDQLYHNLDLVPIIIEGFMKQSCQYSKSLQKMSLANNQKNTSIANLDKLASTQFRFWCNTFNPLLTLLYMSANLMSANLHLEQVLRAMNQSLEILAENDSYLPSYNDQDNEHLNYLSAVGETVLGLMEENSTNHDGGISSQFYRTLEILLNLNHHIFHSKLSRIFWLIAQINSVSEDTKYASTLVSSICSVYERLRQLSHLLRAILCHFDTRILDENFDPLEVLRPKLVQKNNRYNFLLNDTKFVQSLSNAISSIPSGQIQDIWQVFNKGMLLVESDEEKTEGIVDFFVIFLKAIHVNQFNAKFVMSSCENTMKHYVTKLIGVEKFNSANSSFDVNCPFTNTGLYLCGWVVHVYNNACFWLSDIPDDSASESDDFHQQICGVTLAPLLLNSIRSVLHFQHAKEKSKGNELGSLQHLASHRIEMLHSTIHLQQQYEEFNSSSNAKEDLQSNAMIAEATLLVDFLLFSAENRCLSNNAMLTCRSSGSKVATWKIIAQTLSSWIPYSKIKHIDSFLEWLFVSLATEEKLYHATESIKSNGVGNDALIQIQREERDVVIALLHDTSFFEIHKINERFVLIALGHIKKLLESNQDSRIIKLLQHENLTADKFSQLIRAVIGLSPLSDKDTFGKSLQIMKLLYKLSGRLQIRSNIHSTLSITLRLLLVTDRIMLNKCESGKHEDVTVFVEMASTLRRFLAHTLTQINAGSHHFRINDLVKYLLSVVNQKTQSKMNKEQRQRIISSTSELLKEVVVLALKDLTESTSCFSALEEALSSSPNLEFNINLIGPVIHELNMLHRLPGKKLTFLDPMIEVAANVMNKIKQSIEKSKSKNAPMDRHLIAFVADALYLYCIYSGDRSTSTMHIEWFITHFYDACLECLKSNCGKASEDHLISISSYFLSFASCQNISQRKILALGRSIEDLQSIIISMVRSRGTANPLIDSAYSTQLSDCTHEEVNILLDSLVGRCADDSYQIDSIQATLHCFHIIMNVLKGKDHVKVIASKTLHFLQIALLMITLKMNHFLPLWTSGIKIALSTLTSLIFKNDLVILKGSHVANILAGISSINHQLQLFEVDRQSTHETYLLNCGTLNALLRQYSKHLYGCVPSFNCTLRSMLKVVTVYDCCQEDVNPIKEMVREFSKICEMLPEHKDIFKKHIMFLIVDHIDFLGNSNAIQLQRNKLLESIIMLLLECLTTYENQQLASMIPLTGKPILQSILKNFQKHQYKGQF